MNNKKGRSTRTSIGLDMDGTMFDFTGQFVELYNELHPDDQITEEKISQSWNLQEYCKYPVTEIFNVPGFYSYMKPYEGMKEVFRKLNEEYQTFIITTTPPAQINERIWSLKRLYPEFDIKNFFMASKKDMIKTGILVDDAPHNFNDVVSRDDGQILLLYDQPYNQHINSKYRVKNPYEIYDFAKEFLVPKKDLLTHQKYFFL